jgi:hypothetical protein
VDAKSSLGDAKRSLGDAKSSLGDAKSSLGDAKSSPQSSPQQLFFAANTHALWLRRGRWEWVMIKGCLCDCWGGVGSGREAGGRL